MKILVLIIIALFASTASVPARSRDEVKLRTGQQKIVERGELKLKFVSVAEDSRCPINARCVWAGNAKIRISVVDANGRSKVLEMNTTTGLRGDQFGGYAINLTGLTQPGRGKGMASEYVASLSVKRLTR